MNTMEVNKRGKKYQARYRWRTPGDKKLHTTSKTFARKSDVKIGGLNSVLNTFKG